jgi:hypothetical protein
MDTRLVKAFASLNVMSVMFAIGMCFTWGCGNSDQLETAPVSGRVLIDGKPLTTGTVAFIPQQGRGARGNIQSDGSFELSTYQNGDGAVLGTHRATVTAIESGGSSSQPEERDIKYLTPARYSIAGESGLVFEVKAGEANKFTLELKSE